MSTDPKKLQQTIIERLSEVIDPETGADVLRMRLIEDLVASEDGRASYAFRPSSPLCPIAVYLVQRFYGNYRERTHIWG